MKKPRKSLKKTPKIDEKHQKISEKTLKIDEKNRKNYGLDKKVSIIIIALNFGFLLASQPCI